MSPFKVLRLNELLMAWLHIYSHPLDVQTIPTNELFKTFSTYWILFTVIAFISSSAGFVYQNLSNVVTALRTGMVTIGTSQSLGMFLSVGCKIDQVQVLHQKLQAIVDQAVKDGHDNIVKMYWRTERKCFSYTQMMLYYIYFHQMPCVAALAYAIYCIYTNNIDTSAWNLPFNVFVPFDTQYILGWLLVWLFELCAGFAYILCMIIPTTYFFCFCLYIVAICNHFDLLVEKSNEDFEQIQWDTKGQRKNVVQLIGIHVNLLDVFDLVENVNTGAIFSLLPVNSVVLGLSMYTMENSEFEVVERVIDIICVICALIWCSLFCYFANMASNRLTSIGFAAYSANWYNYPVEWQKFIVLIISRSQDSNVFNGLNLINCTMETFGTLCKSACSYYIIFRRMEGI